MALVRFETNSELTFDREKIIRQNLTKVIARFTRLPENEVSVEVAGSRAMRMAENNDPIAHVEIRDADIAKDRAKSLTQAICPVIEEVMGIHKDHIYIAVVSARNAMWRVNGEL